MRLRAPDAGLTPGGKIVEAEKAAPEIAREAIEMIRSLYAVEKQATALSAPERLDLRQKQSAPVLAQTAPEASRLEGVAVAQASHGRGGELRAGPMDGVERLLSGWSSAHRQQPQRARDQTGGVEPQELLVCWQSTRRSNGIYIGQPDKYLPPPRYRSATVSYSAPGELAIGAHHSNSPPGYPISGGLRQSTPPLTP